MQVTSSASALLRATPASRATDAAARRQETATVPVADDGSAKKSEREKEDGKLLRGLQEVLSWLRESSSSVSEARKQAATRKADELRRQLQFLRKLMIGATPEQAKSFARQLRAIARQLTALAKELSNDGGGAGDPAARAAGSASADASGAAQGAASGRESVSAASQASAGENGEEAAADGSENESGAPAEAQQLAGMERAAAQAEQQAREARQSGRIDLRGASTQKGSESDSQLRRMLAEARKELKGALALLKARLPRDDRDVRAIEKALSELEKQLGDGAPAVPAAAAYDASGAAAPAVSATAGAAVGATVSVQA